MKVTLEPHIGRSVASPPGEFLPVRLPQYRIIVDGNCMAGYIGTQEGAKALLIVKFTPLEIKEIERQIAEILQTDSVSSNSRPDVPPGLLSSSDDEEEMLDVDDFDS